MINIEKFLNKIEDKSLKLGVVGLGYVGLPLAVEKAKSGFDVIGFDIQEEKVNKINKGENYIGDVVSEDLSILVKSGKLKASTNPNIFQNLDAIAICVPTPLDIYKQPNMSYIESSIDLIAKNISSDTLIVLESTTYPGTTEEILMPKLESENFIVGETVFLAYSPERVDPGNKFFNTNNTPKVVGGVTNNCTKIASALYREILKGEVHEVSSPAIAEMEKILENTFRNINIALANEMSILCDKMDIDVWEVIDAASSKPYGFMPFYPGPGLGGHCIPIDPWYLTYKAREFGYHTKLIEIAGEINGDMPIVIVNKIIEILNINNKSLNGSNILILGLAYKKDIDDYRESPILNIIDLVEKRKGNVTIVDPYIDKYIYKGENKETTILSDELLINSDLVVIATNHTVFDYKNIYDKANLIFDTRNSYQKGKTNKYYKL